MTSGCATMPHLSQLVRTHTIVARGFRSLASRCPHLGAAGAKSGVNWPIKVPGLSEPGQATLDGEKSKNGLDSTALSRRTIASMLPGKTQVLFALLSHRPQGEEPRPPKPEVHPTLPRGGRWTTQKLSMRCSTFVYVCLSPFVQCHDATRHSRVLLP